MIVFELERYKLVRHPMIWGLTAFIFLILALLFQRLCVDYLTLAQQALTQQKSSQSVSLEIIKPICSWTIMLLAFFLPVFTTLSMSQELRQKTFYLWAMSDFSPIHIILGKFISLVSFTLLIIGFLFCMLSVLHFESSINFGMLLGGFLAVLLISSAFISFGLFISCLIPIPLLAIGVALLGNILWMLLEWLNPFGESAQYLASQFSLLAHSYHLLNGILFSPDLVFYFSFCGCWLVLSVIVLKYKMRHVRG